MAICIQEKTKLLPTDPLFWLLLQQERFMVDSYFRSGGIWADSAKEHLIPILKDLRKLHLATYKDAYMRGYARIKIEDKCLAEMTQDLNTILQDNGMYGKDPWLLWRFIYDDDAFQVTAGRVIKEHEAGLNSSEGGY